MNWLKDKLTTRTAVHGIWLASGSHVAAEVAAAAGFDWALIDMEHGLGDEADTLRLLQVLSGTAVAPVVRVPSATSDLVKRVLDFGASGVMAPMINRAAQAEAFARSLRYPPGGIRGMTSSSRAARYGFDFADYFKDANARITGIAQIETADAVDQADAIAAVDGIDVLFIGHSDLSLALGCFQDLTAPALLEAERRVLSACARHGKKAGMLLKAGESSAAYLEKGFSLLALGTDIGCLKQGFTRLLARER